MIRARFQSSTPFSHRLEQATTKLALTYLCPTPYAVKVAFIVGAIRSDAKLKPEDFTRQIRAVKLIPHPYGEGVINTHLIKHWQPPRNKYEHPPAHLSPSIAFREFVYFDGGVDVYIPDEAKSWLVPVLPYVNTFGKQGGLFSLLSVEEANPPVPNTYHAGSDMKPKAEWKQVSNFEVGSNNKKPRDTNIWMEIRAELVSAGNTYKYYRFG